MHSDLLLNDTVDTLANGAVVGAFLGGAFALLIGREERIQHYAAKGAVLGGFAGIAAALGRGVSS